MMWKIFAAIGAAVSAHAGAQMSARNQRAPAYAGDVNVRDVQANNLNSNYANLPGYEMLTRQANESAQQQKSRDLEASMPGYTAWAKDLAETAKGYSSGKLDTGQSNTLVRKQAEQAWGGAVRGQAGDYSLLKSFGQAQLQNVQYSQNIMAQLERMSKADVAGVQEMYTTMDEALGTALSNRSAKQAWLNAEQTAKNIRKNAIWASSGAWANTNASAMSKGKPTDSAAQNSYKDMNEGWSTTQ